MDIDMLWGTRQPVMLGLRSGVASLVARGSLSCAVSNPQQFAQQVGDAQSEQTMDDLRDRLRSMVVMRLTDALGESSRDKSEAAEIVAISQEIAAAVKAQVEDDLNTLGLTLKELSIADLRQL